MKKLLLLISLMFLSLPTFANYADHGNPCYDDKCSSEMLDIWDHFLNSNGSPSAMDTVVLAGSCYHKSSYYHPSQEHYAGVFLYRTEKTLQFRSRFIFYAEENPYNKWDQAQAKQEYPSILAKENAMELYKDLAYIVYMPGQKYSPHYWLKSNEDQSEFYLYSYWGAAHSVFCKLTPNPQQ